MKRFFGNSSKGNGEKTTTQGKKETGDKNQASARKQDGQGKGPSTAKGETRSQAGPKGPKGPKTARNAQSALRPANSSGLQKQKEHPLIQFGPVLKEFLSSRELVNKSVSMKYTQTDDQFEVAVSFKKVLDNGVSTSGQLDMKIEDYLAQRKTLLKVKDESSHYVGFLSSLIDRLNIDISAAKPSVAFRSVETFVSKHLSPVERAILSLTKDEFDRVDTRKIPEIMKPSLAVIKDHYGGFDERSKFLVYMINTEGPVKDKEPPNWVLGGVTGLSKGVLLDTLKLVHVPKISEEQKKVIEALQQSLLGDDMDSHPDAEGKRDDVVL